MNIDKKKCNSWCALLLKFMRMTNSLNIYEKRYLASCITIAIENLNLKELLEKTEGKDV